MSFETKRNLKNLGIVTVLFGTLSFYGFNCAPPSFSTSDDGSQSVVTGAGGAVTPIDEVGTGGGTLDTKTDLPYALLTAEQIFNSLTNVTGQTNYSNAILNEYNLRSGSFSVSPDLKFVNGPMLIAITSLAGEVCNGLVTREQAIAFNAGNNARQYFNQVDFGAVPATGIDANRMSDAVNKLANSFWGRAPSSDETTLYSAFRTEFLAAAAAQNAAQTRALALALCTSMLSSFDTYSY